MSGYMDDVDREFIKCLFPEYLLQQPVAYYLWMTYYQHKKLFHKIKHSNNNIINNNSLSKDASRGKLQSRLSYSARKEIWQKLMSLGVLGTLSFDSANDEYLVQVYKYFYPGSVENYFHFSSTTGDIDPVTAPGYCITENANDNNDGVEDLAKRTIAEREIIEEFDLHSTAEIGGNGGDQSREPREEDNDEEGIAHEEDDEEQTSQDEDDGEDDDDDDDDGDDDGDDDDEIAEEEENSSHSTGNSSSRTSNTEAVSFYPALATRNYPPKSKNNSIVPDIYRVLDYFLPSQWIAQPNNSILLSADGISQLGPNPNWQAYMAYERSSASTRNRLRNSFSGNQKNDFAVTWANNSLHLNKLGIFYYEIRILSVTSLQGAQNSNIIVGYKYWPESDAEASPKGADNDQASSTSSSTTGIGAGLRSSLRGSGATTEATSSVEPAASTSKTGIEEGFFGYCGSDGSITAGSQYKSYSKPFGRDDVIGCGVNYVNGTIFFTKNGVCLGTAFTEFYDVNLIPYIALRPGNSVRTNFGLYEEFVFDIVGYQDRWKAKAYKHIFKSIDNSDLSNEFDSEEEEKEEERKNDAYMDVDEPESLGTNDDGSVAEESLLLRDSRFQDDQLIKPNVDKLNTLNTGDDSIPSTLHIMINDYLIHEGLIDVAKGFLKDLKKDIVPDNTEGKGESIIRHNERQIIKEEKNLKIRQDLRRFITNGNISQCLKYIETHLPGLLKENLELQFELKLAKYLLTILHYTEYPIERIVAKGQDLSKEFVYNETIAQPLREKFRNQLSNISALLAYDDPINESPEELATYLSSEYLQDRLFQVVNTSVLTFLKKNSDCELENVVRYTRTMLSTLMNYDAEGSVVFNGTEFRYFKILNMDEDLLNLN